jgi:hypothetical protein
LLSVTTTHALLALKVQRKVSNGVAGWSPPDHLWIGQKIAAIPAISAMRLLTKARQPSCVSPTSQLTRE